MNGPPVSVLIPFRNAEAYFEQALASVASQTYEDIEVLMVNDCSTDYSISIAEHWCGKDCRFRLADSSGEGLVDALNTGLRLCRGSWVARMDADDICMPDRIGRQLELARRCGPRTVVTCRVRSFPRDLVSEGYRAYENWLNRLTEPEEIEKNLFVESPVPHPTAFYHRGVLQEGGYMERDLPEDYELWLRLWSRGYSFARVPEVLLGWRDRADRLSRTSPAYSLTSFYRLKARYLGLVPCMSDKKVYVAGAGQTARRLGRCLQDNGFRIEAFLTSSPGRTGRRLRGRPVVASNALKDNPGVPVVIASRQPGARAAISEYLLGIGLREWKDFVACS